MTPKERDEKLVDLIWQARTDAAWLMGLHAFGSKAWEAADRIHRVLLEAGGLAAMPVAEPPDDPRWRSAAMRPTDGQGSFHDEKPT